MSPSIAASDGFERIPPSSPSNDASVNRVYTQSTSTSGPTPAMSVPPPSTQTRNILESISDAFTPFDVQSSIVQPFQTETERDAQFERDLTSMLLDVMLEFYAWSAARPRGESEASGSAIEDRIGAVMKTQMEQGTFSSSLSRIFPFLRPPNLIEDTRKRLVNFITQVKTALDALTGNAF
ncbi:hypothetical protein ONZ45_g9923 [Pleurotus djamor]|nr:hypothetical protein ONZ45_g9923 [Pleurotus djamor]